MADEYIRHDLRGAATAAEQDYAATFVISGMVAMMEQRLREDDSSAPESPELAGLVCSITGSEGSV